MELKETFTSMLPTVYPEDTDLSIDDEFLDNKDISEAKVDSYDHTIDDIYYNKILYENGEINLCFIIGYSGSGKGWLSKDQQGKTRREIVDVDRIIIHGALNKDDDYFKEQGDFVYEFMVKGAGKKYREDLEIVKQSRGVKLFQRPFIQDLINTAKQYTNSNKSIRLILDGIYFYRFCEPSDLKDYAVYIKGTSFKKSLEQAIARNTRDTNRAGSDIYRDNSTKAKIMREIISSYKSLDAVNGSLQRFIDYYKPLYERQMATMKQDTIKSSINDLKNLTHDQKLKNAKVEMKQRLNTTKDEISNLKSVNKHAIEDTLTSVKKESVFNYNLHDYMVSPYRTTDYYYTENLNDFIINFKTEFNVEKSIRKLIISLALTKAKLKMAIYKEVDPAKIKDIKREIVKLTKELNDYKKSISSNDMKDVKKLEDVASKEADKEIETEINELEKELLDSENVAKSSIDTADDKVKNNEEVKKESTEDINNDSTKYPSTIKRLDEDRGKLDDLQKKYDTAKKLFEKTGESIYEKKMKGLSSQIEGLKSKIESLEKLGESIDTSNEVTEATNMEEEIKPIVDKLNELGYKVKYASPGHEHLRKKEDKEPDGVYYNRLYSDARIMFADKYNLGDAPKYWHFRIVDGCSYLDITPYVYDDKDGTPDEAFTKWKNNYMQSLKDFVKALEDKKGDSNKEEKDADAATVESFMNDIFKNMEIYTE